MAVGWSSSKTTATQLTSITTEQFFTTIIGPAANEVAHVEVEVDFPATPTDRAIVSVYGTLDASSENWDDTPIMQFTLENSPDPNKVSFRLFGVYRYRIGVKRSGTTDTLASADMAYRLATLS